MTPVSTLSDATNPENPAACIIAGLPVRKQIAESLGVSERTIIRWEHQGLPVIRLGMARLYDPAKVRAWVLTHESRHDAPKRGRPAKRAA